MVKLAEKLTGHRRNEHVTIKVRGNYGAGSVYTWEDVVRIAEKIEAGEMKTKWLDPNHKKHDPTTMNVPYSTMREWLEDDAHFMQRRCFGKVLSTTTRSSL